MAYRVELPVFSGPMDLLLHLVKQQEVDIHEVRISDVLKQYLAHVELLKALDLGDLGDFLVMASTLMEIKSRELLPREEVDVEEGFDPKDDLIRRLLEYKRYRDISRRLDRMMHRRARMVDPEIAIPKDGMVEPGRERSEPEMDLGDLGIWHLTEAFAQLLEETGGARELRFDVSRRDVRFYAERVLALLKAEREVEFSRLFDRSEGRGGLIGVFTMLLEMMKQGYVRAHQEECRGPIQVAYLGEADTTVDEILSREEDYYEDEDEADSADESAAEPVAEALEVEAGGEAPSAEGEIKGAADSSA